MFGKNNKVEKADAQVAPTLQTIDDESEEETDPRMFERTDAKPCIIYPENTLKELWDALVSILLLVTCILTPMMLSFNLEGGSMDTFNVTMDSFFAFDIVLTFFSATQDDDYYIIDDLKTIACNYIQGWFLIDLVAIVPF